MSIFFRFGDPQLLKLVVSQYFAQRIFQRFRSKGNGSFYSFVILRHTNKIYRTGCLRTRKIRKFFIYKCSGQLPCPVGTEIEKNHAVTGFDARICFRCSYERNYKFISDPARIRSTHTADRISTNSAVMQNHSVISFLHTFPAFIAVHSVRFISASSSAR